MLLEQQDVGTNNKFNLNYFFLIICGFQLGGNTKQNFLRNSSVVYAKKNTNFIVKISLTSLQLKKILKLMARYTRRS
jgi:ribosomal protein S2